MKGSLRVLGDISRAGDWIDMIASRVRDEYDFSITQAKFAKQELDKCETEVAKIQYMDNARKNARKILMLMLKEKNL